ncbi:MAG: DUF222 domain-containing protein [Acidimicrobiia bacterium]|nr:DUF222 domain-containing protein [Acidimicrobiia bacterium]
MPQLLDAALGAPVGQEQVAPLADPDVDLTVSLSCRFPDDLTGLSVDQLCRCVAAISRAQSRLEGQRFRLVGELNRRRITDPSVDPTQILRTEGGLTARQATKQNGLASRSRELAEPARQMAAGQLTSNHFEQLGRAQQAHPEAFQNEQHALMANTQGMGADRLRAVISDWIARRDHDDGADRFRRQHQNRYLSIKQLSSGMIGIRGELDPEAGSKIQTVLGHAANDLWQAETRNTRPTSSASQRLADALTETVTRQGAMVLGGRGHPGRPVLHIAVNYQELVDQLAGVRNPSGMVSPASSLDPGSPPPNAAALVGPGCWPPAAGEPARPGSSPPGIAHPVRNEGRTHGPDPISGTPPRQGARSDSPIAQRNTDRTLGFAGPHTGPKDVGQPNDNTPPVVVTRSRGGTADVVDNNAGAFEASDTCSDPIETSVCDRSPRSKFGFSSPGTATNGVTISPATIRRLACDADIIPTVLGSNGVVLDQGRRVRTATSAQRSALIQRDKHCVFPECDRPPSWCQAHHLKPWEDGGATDLDNMALICSSHHHLVHEGQWTLTRGPNGTWTAQPPQHHRLKPPSASTQPAHRTGAHSEVNLSP